MKYSRLIAKLQKFSTNQINKLKDLVSNFPMNDQMPVWDDVCSGNTSLISSVLQENRKMQMLNDQSLTVISDKFKAMNDKMVNHMTRASINNIFSSKEEKKPAAGKRSKRFC